MTTAITLTALAIVFYFFKKSKSNFFLQDSETLAEKKHQIIMVLRFKGLKTQEINKFTEAYDYFRNNPKKFDGATIVKDLNDIKGLDLKAMLHDYECLMGANSSYRLWYVSAYDYYLNHFKIGNGNQILRFLGLCILGIFFVPYCKIKLIYL